MYLSNLGQLVMQVRNVDVQWIKSCQVSGVADSLTYSRRVLQSSLCLVPRVIFLWMHSVLENTRPLFYRKDLDNLWNPSTVCVDN